MSYSNCETACVSDFASVQDALDYVGEKGGTLTFPPGTYALESQATLEPTTLENIHIIGYGAEITTAGAISGLKILAAYNLPEQIVVEGLKVNQRGNSSATAGFELVQSNFVTFRNCTVEAHGVSASYGAFWFHQSNTSDPDTGCFWNVLDGCSVRKRSGGDSGDITYAVKLQGACNASRIIGGAYGATTCVYLTPESGQSYITNAATIDGAAFEGFTTAIHAAGATSAAISGLRVTNCRAEAGTTFLSLTGSASQPVTPPFLAGNYLTPDVAYINNPNGLYTLSLDSSTNGVNGPELDLGALMRIRNVAGTGHTMDLWASATGATIQQWNDSAGNLLARLEWVTDANTSRTRLLSYSGSLNIDGIMGLSGTTTDARNLRGSVTLSSGTAAVSFGNAEPDTSYFIALGGNANETFRWGSKATSGFSITSSNGSSTAVVDWHLIR